MGAYKWLFVLGYFLWFSGGPALGNDVFVDRIDVEMETQDTPESKEASLRRVDLQCLKASYEDLARVEKEDDILWLYFIGGERVRYSRRGEQEKTDVFDQATVEESLAQVYPLEPLRPAPAVGEHPGRVRSYPLLEALYGHSEDQVKQQLVTENVVQTLVRFSARQGAARALAAVNVELNALLEHRSDLRVYVSPASGFTWRFIAGEHRLSPHSFGIAVDLNPAKGPYWRWSKGSHHPDQDSYPTEIVALFEKYGFVWGGKWREYDLMHFEYRPELLCKARNLLFLK